MLSFTKLNLLYLTTFYAPNFVCFFSFIIACILIVVVTIPLHVIK